MSVPVSGLQEAVEKARGEINLEFNRVVLRYSEEFAIVPILETLAREAQREALESVAKEGCQFCARDIPAEIIDGDWFHGHDNLGKVEGDVRLWGWCEADKPILDALSRLRQSASAPDER